MWSFTHSSKHLLSRCYMSTAWIESKASHFLFTKISHYNNKSKGVKDQNQLWLKISELGEVSNVSVLLPTSTNVGGFPLHSLGVQRPIHFSNSCRCSGTSQWRFSLGPSDGHLEKFLGSGNCPTRLVSGGGTDCWPRVVLIRIMVGEGEEMEIIMPGNKKPKEKERKSKDRGSE